MMDRKREEIVKKVKNEFYCILHILRSMQKGHCVIFNKGKISKDFIDIRNFINLFGITFVEMEISDKDFEDVHNFVSSFNFNEVF